MAADPVGADGLYGLPWCHAASTSSFLAWELPVLVMPPRETLSPDELSEGTSPRNDASAGALSKREKSPTSARRENALTVLMPRRQLSAATRPRYASPPASATSLAVSLSFLASHSARRASSSSSTMRSGSVGSSICLSQVRWALVQVPPPQVTPFLGR